MKNNGLVYSTNPDFNLNQIDDNTEHIKKNYILSICFEKKGRKGKGVTIIKGLPNIKSELTFLAKSLKKNLGVGGTIKKQEIIIQGRVQEKIMQLLNEQGYKTKKVGG